MKSLMLISKEKQKYAEIDSRKVTNGAFHTNIHKWLFPQIVSFIKESGHQIILDPFAGHGDILKACQGLGFKKAIGYDIDSDLGWDINNSLNNIPKHDDALVVTNPPYLAKHSAKRKRVFDNIKKYYLSGRDDLYQVALDRCLERYSHIVAIIPETFFNSDYPKDRLQVYTIVEERLFTDTDCPVCAACFGPEKNKKTVNFSIYKDAEYIGEFQGISQHVMKTTNSIKIYFNDQDGQIALKAVDGQKGPDRIRFMSSGDFYYEKSNIKVSSRLMTYIRIDATRKPIDIENLIKESNQILEEYRINTSDICLSPFKGNNEHGVRRRRLDYYTARAIIELAAKKISGLDKKKEHQPCLWSM